MIKFFRHIRKSLLLENKTSRYFKYAIGEIVLVVIGILIALQINNWNNHRIERLNENLILKELHKEFISNKKQFDTVVFYHKKAFGSTIYIKERLPLNLKQINLDSLAYHLFYMGWTYTFNPSKGVTNALMNSSTFNVISNDELRQLLISWDDVVTDYQEEEILARNNYHNQLKPFEKTHFYWSEDYKKWLNDARLDLSILESLAFDNYVLDRYNDLSSLVENPERELELISYTLDKIIELSQPKSHD
ncbi:DUF6090 family protein [Geojedonia litorea]|uniref:DUF6090 family protein n=1 Tax=Geojedonia litorea TaxID=1268269 RepID=A0ABV9N1K3_9FLAO